MWHWDECSRLASPAARVAVGVTGRVGETVLLAMCEDRFSALTNLLTLILGKRRCDVREESARRPGSISHRPQRRQARRW